MKNKTANCKALNKTAILQVVSRALTLNTVLTALFLAQPSFSFDKTRWMDAKREGQQLELSGNFAIAQKYYMESMKIAKTFPPKCSERIETLYHVANILVLQGKYWEAEVFYQKLVMMVQEQKKDGSLDHEALVWMEDLADSYSHSVKGWLQYMALEHAVQLRDIISGDENRYMASTLRQLVTVLVTEGKYTQSEPYATRMVRISSKLKGKYELVKASDLFLLGTIQFNIGKYARSESNLREALEIYTRIEIPPGFCTGNTLTQLSRVLFFQHQNELAEQTAIRALKILDRSKGTNYFGSIQTHEVLRDLYVIKKKYAEAALQHEQIISIMLAAHAASDASMLQLYKKQKDLYLKSKNTAKVREVDRKMNAISKQTSPKNVAHGH